MVTRREVIVGGLLAVVVAVAGVSVAGISTARSDRSLTRAPGTGEAVVSTLSPGVDAPAAVATLPTVAALDVPATVTSTAERIDVPLRIDWVGGSDVALGDVSLPDAFARRVPSVNGRPLVVRTRTALAVMAPGVSKLVDEAVADGTDAIVLSINLNWLHWDDVACQEMTVMHEKYECLLSPISPTVSAQRAAELQGLIDNAVAADVPLYVYSLPHSTDVLGNPAVAGLIASAEASVAAYDPGRPDVRFVARVFTRDTEPMYEGVDFIDMVHPTVVGAERLADWLAADIAAFWASTGLGR